jgi:hypothetical protein
MLTRHIWIQLAQILAGYFCPRGSIASGIGALNLHLICRGIIKDEEVVEDLLAGARLGNRRCVGGINDMDCADTGKDWRGANECANVGTMYGARWSAT